MDKVEASQCRLCLKKSQYCYSLFDKDLTDIIEAITSIKICKNDDLPSNCCSHCLEDIYTVSKIRKRIIESDKVLRENLQQNEETSIQIKSEVKDEECDQSLTSTTESASELVNLKSEETNSEEEDYECTECDLKFHFRKYYLEHMKKHINHVSVCLICERQVLTCNFKRHMEVHKSTPKVCDICGSVAKNAESLRGHMFYMHKSSAEQYKCAECGRCYRYKYKFRLHQRKAHGGEKTHICEFCGKDFYTARDVKRHIQMTHLKLRPYVCQYCNKGFSSSYARRTHVRQHTNERPFRCEYCAEGFRQRVSLKTHLKSKHGIDVRAEQVPLAQDPLLIQTSTLI